MRKSQPQGLLRIDWKNPITRGLVLACPLGRDLYDVVGRSFLTNTGNVDPEVDAKGISRRFSGGASKALTTTLTTHAVQRTFVWRHIRRGDGGNSLGRIFDKRTVGSGAENILWNAGSGFLQYDRVRNTSTGQWTWSDTLNVQAITALSYDSSSTANDPVVYVNGLAVTVTEANTPSGTITDTTDPYVIGNRTNDLAREWDGSIADFLVFDRILTPDEMRSITLDPWQVYESRARKAYKAPVTGGSSIQPGLGQLTITGLAPTVAATAHVSISSGLGALTLTGLAPSLNLGMTSGLGQLTITGLAPTLAITENVSVASGLGQLTITGLAPTVSVSNNLSITTGLGQLAISGLAPQVGDNPNISAGFGQLTITGLAPSVAVSENVFITSGLGALVLTGLAPQVGDNPNISTGLGALTITGHAPSLSATEHQFATPSAGALAITGLAPDVRQQLYVSIGLATLTINGFAPTVTEAGASITTGLGELVIIGYAPSIQGGEAEVSRGAGRRTKRERYIARYKGEEFEFSTYDDLEEFVQQVKKAEAQKPRKIRKPVRIRLEPSFVEEIREYVDIPAQIYQLPASKALEQVRKLEMSIKKVDDDDEEEIWLILTG